MKIFLLGSGPLPNQKKGLRNAGGLRTHQFLETIKKIKELEIHLITIEENLKEKLQTKNLNNNIQHTKISKNHPKFKKTIQAYIKKLNPKLVIGINTFPSFILAKIITKKKIPFWADLNGWAMGEAQAQAKSLESNAFIPQIYKMEKTILNRADKISVVSTPQAFAVLGELAFLGRLNKDNFHYTFTEIIKNSPFIEKISNSQKNTLNLETPKNAFLITQIGGFNAWLDEKTLFQALELAIQKNNKIHFICTGGILKNIDEKTFPTFQNRINKSKLKKHFHFLGWVDSEKIPQIYALSNCTINVDFKCPETLIGARNRITESLQFQTPIITTLGSEIAQKVVNNQAGLGSPNSEVSSLTENILLIANNQKLQKELTQNGIEMLHKEFSIQKTGKPLINWLNNFKNIKLPNQEIIDFSKNNFFQAGFLYLKKRGFKAFISKLWQKIK